MIQKLNDDIHVRNLNELDKKEFTGLKLKRADRLEVEHGVGMTPKEYLKWHFDTHMDITRGLYYKGKLFGFIAITDDGTVCFLTEDIKFPRKYLLKHFKDVLYYSMYVSGKESVHAYVDTEYTQSEEWIKRFGFVFTESVEAVAGYFNMFTYYRQFDANREVGANG